MITFAIVFTGCKNIAEDQNALAFRPLLNKPYQFSVLKSATITWTYQDSLHKRRDTTIVIFTLKNITASDSSYSCTLHFDQYIVKMPPVEVTLLNVDLSKPFFVDHTFSLFDSIGYYAKGLLLRIEMSKKGIVEKVDSLPEMLAAIAAKSHRDYGSVKSLLQDHLSVNGITDLLNRTFSAPPNKTIAAGFRWSNTTTLITKAPVDIRTFYIPAQTNGDSLSINTSLLINSGDSNDVLKGTGKGFVILSHQSGMPYSAESNSQTVTYMTEGSRTEKENIKVEQLF